MDKIDIKRKLTSRKFWLAFIGLVSGILLAFRVDAETIETISGCIMSAASVIAYIIGEGLTDAASMAWEDEETKPPEELEPERR